MDVGREGRRIVERSDADEGRAPSRRRIMTPQGDAADRTARDFLSLAAFRRGRNIIGRPYDLQPVAFDHRVDNKGAAGLELAPTTMAAENDHRRFGNPVDRKSHGSGQSVSIRLDP